MCTIFRRLYIFYKITIQVLSGFKFISEQKEIKTDYIVTTDDDCYVSLPQFYEVFKNKTMMNNINCGFSYGEAEKPLR